MNAQLQHYVHKSVAEVDGIIFKGQGKLDEKSKIFYSDRYINQLSKYPIIPSGGVGLEVGLMEGILALTLQKLHQPKQLFAIEHPVTAKLYSKKYLELIKKAGITLKTVDLRTFKYPWKDNTFDFIVISEVLEHLVPADIPKIISELTRTLKKGGQLIVTTPNIASLLKRINLAFGKNPIEFDLTLHEKATYGHIREYTMSEVHQILEQAGLTVTQRNYIVIDAKRSIFTRIEATAAKAMPSLGNDLVIVGRK
jgi:ubiquinone/menaquinone biosynthesis C-methylase UbiE